MKKQNKNMFIISLLVLSIVMIAYGLTSVSQNLALFNQAVYIGEYSRASCVADRDRPVTILNSKDVSDSGEYFACNPSEKGIYVPNDEISSASERECIFKVTRPTSGLIKQLGENYICNLNENVGFNTKCQMLNLDQGLSSYIIKVPLNKKLYLNPTTSGSEQFKISGTIVPWKLKIIYDNNFQDWTNDCSLASLSVTSQQGKDYSTLNKEDIKTLVDMNKLIIKPGETVQVVTAAVQKLSGRVITRVDINNNNPIYIEKAGEWFGVNKADDGNYYVDMSKPHYNVAIECVPSLFCDSEAKKIVTPEQQKCSELLGNYKGYVPVSNNEACTYSCNTLLGKPTKSNNCVKYGDKCPADTPFWDSINGKCVSNNPKVIIQETPSYLIPILIALAGVLIATTIIIIKYKKRK